MPIIVSSLPFHSQSLLLVKLLSWFHKSVLDILLMIQIISSVPIIILQFSASSFLALTGTGFGVDVWMLPALALLFILSYGHILMLLHIQWWFHLSLPCSVGWISSSGVLLLIFATLSHFNCVAYFNSLPTRYEVLPIARLARSWRQNSLLSAILLVYSPSIFQIFLVGLIFVAWLLILHLTMKVYLKHLH